MRRLIFCALLVGLLSACELPPPTAEVAGCLQPINLVRTVPQHDAVWRRFGSACNLERQPDLDFGGGLSTYICGVVYPSVPNRAEEIKDRLAAALGPLGPVPDFTPEVLGREIGLHGWAYDIVLLADADGEIVSILTTRTQLVNLQAVRSPRAAARLVRLKGGLDRMEQTWLCSGGAYQSGDGWTFPAVPENCKLGVRDISVSGKGEVSVGPTKETNRMVCGQFD